METLTLIQTKTTKIPIVLFGKEFWNSVLIGTFVDCGTISKKDLDLFL